MGKSVQVGDTSKLRIIVKMADMGFKISLPMSEDLKYDFIADDGTKLWRVQAKTAVRKADLIMIKGKSSSYWNQYRYTSDDIDILTAYDSMTQSIYAVKSHELGSTGIDSISLRMNPPKNGQSKGIRWAKDYLIDLVLSAGVEPA